MRGRVLLVLLAVSFGASCSYDPVRAPRTGGIDGGVVGVDRGTEPVQRMAELAQGGRLVNEKF